MALDLSAYDVPVTPSPLVNPDEISAIIGKSFSGEHAYDVPVAISPFASPEERSVIDEIHAVISGAYAEISSQMPPGAYAWLKAERPDVFDTIRIEEERLDAAAADLDTEAVLTHAARCGKYWCRAWYLYDQANPRMTA